MSYLRSLSLDIRNADPQTIASLYSTIDTLASLRSLSIFNLPEYLRDRHRLILQFNFAETGHRFDLSRLASLLLLSHLNVCASNLAVQKHPELKTNLQELVLKMPVLDKQMVNTLFQLRSLKILRIVEPKAIPRWALPGDLKPHFVS
jgi:hypothetical protein